MTCMSIDGVLKKEIVSKLCNNVIVLENSINIFYILLYSTMLLNT